MNSPLEIPVRKIFFAGWCLLLAFLVIITPTVSQTDSLAANLHGHSLLQSGHYEAALNWATEALALKPDTLPLKAELLTIQGNALRHLGQTEKAIETHLTVLNLRERHFGKNTLEVAKSCQNLGNCWLDLEQPNQALPFLSRAKTIRETQLQPPHDALASIYNSFAEAERQQRHYERAEQYLEQALDMRQQLFPGNLPKVAPMLIGKSTLYLEQEQYKSAWQTLQPLLELMESPNGAPSDMIALACQNLGHAQLGLGHSAQALLWFQKALELVRDNADHFSTYADGLVSLGQYYQIMGEPTEAEYYLRQALPLYQKREQRNATKIANTYNDLGLCYRYQDRLTEAIRFHEKAINLYRNHGKEQHSNLIGFYHNLGKCFLQTKNAGGARYYFQKALNIPGDIRHKTKLEVQTYLLLGNSYLSEQQVDQAQQQFDLARRRYETLQEKAPLLSQLIHYSLGLVHTAKEDFDLAMAHIKTGLEVLNDLESYTISTTLYPYERAQLLTGKGRVLQQQGIKERNNTLLKQALLTYQQAAELTRSIQTSFTNEQSQLYLLDDFSALYHGLMATCFHLNQQDATYLAQAFQYAEAYKGAQLRQLLLKSKAKSYAGVPDSLVQQEKQLKQARYFLEQQCRKEEQQTFPNREQLEQNYQQLQAIIEQQNALAKKIEQQFRDYANLQHQDSVIALGHVQKMLTEAQTLVEYTLTDSLLFTFVINKDTAILRRQRLAPDFTKRVEDFYYFLRIRPDLQPNQLESARQLTALAHQLYQELLQPVESFLRSELLIIPDNILCYLSFDALLNKPVSHAHLFAKHPFLARQYAISYCYSASLLQLMSEKVIDQPRNALLAFAPYFKERLPELTYNTQETSAIMSLVKGQQWQNKKAQKSTFVKESPYYRFLHLATHSAMDGEFPDNSYLAFSETPGLEQDTFLMYLSEVYGLPLQAELVTLSACQTGIGVLRKGESLISMARAFSYAGAKSIIASLWSIDDQQTSILIKQFYKNLSQGVAKNRALQESKIHYLEQAGPELAHPYYWAALTAIGDPSPVQQFPARNNWWWKVAIGIVLLGLILLFAKRKSLPANA